MTADSGSLCLWLAHGSVLTISMYKRINLPVVVVVLSSGSEAGLHCAWTDAFDMDLDRVDSELRNCLMVPVNDNTNL